MDPESATPATRTAVTPRLEVSREDSGPFLRAVTAGRVTVEATALSQGRTQQLWRVDFTDQSGRLIAHGELRLQNVAGKS